jgi:hypothetical protein
MTQKTESRIVLAFAIAAAISVGIGAIGSVLPQGGGAPSATTLAAAEASACTTAGCFR